MCSECCHNFHSSYRNLCIFLPMRCSSTKSVLCRFPPPYWPFYAQYMANTREIPAEKSRTSIHRSSQTTHMLPDVHGCFPVKSNVGFPKVLTGSSAKTARFGAQPRRRQGVDTKRSRSLSLAGSCGTLVSVDWKEYPVSVVHTWVSTETNMIPYEPTCH